MKKLNWTRKTANDLLFTVMIFIVTLLAGLLLKFSLDASDQIPLIFVLGVMLIALRTDGYWWGIAVSFLEVFVINFVFVDPLMAFNFSPYTIPSAIVTLAVSLTTSALTIQVKEQEKIRIAAEKEQMRAVVTDFLK